MTPAVPSRVSTVSETPTSTMHSRSACLLVHITTVPQTLGFLRRQVGYMRDRGLEVHAISSPGERLDAFGREEGVPTHALEMPRRITPLRDALALLQLTRLLHRLHPTIVHAHTPKGGLLGMLAAWLARVPLRVYHVHGLPLMTAAGLKRALLTWTEHVSCLCASRVLCVSPSIRQVAMELHLCPPHKIAVLGAGTINGIDARGRFNPASIPPRLREEQRSAWGVPPEAPVIAFVGRIVHDKGVDDLIAAWSTLRERYPNLHLVVAGEFEPQDSVSPCTEQAMRSDPRIRLLGHVSDMPVVYAAVDLVALPTYREGFGLVLAEASAMCLPVVATAVPGCVDAVVDGVTGTLVPPRDSEALATAIARYLDDPALRERHGRAGRERVLRDFQPEAIWEATYQQYVRLLRERGLPEPTLLEAAS